ncbi:MAG: hypothetical protein CBARDMAM_4162 [uncultured Caballeronia sp.]|nr:MAG: hypothetical protein CBARDMAM_4162 [uncultured Caballeronia sp.]
MAGGVSRANAPSESTYTWSFTYLQPLNANNALSYSWINEGHYPNHHPDGFALQYWRRIWFFNDRLAVSGGVDAYNFFDTTAFDEGKRYADVHGWSLIYSLDATWYTRIPWFYQVRVNRIDTFHTITTTSAMFGIGYQLGGTNHSGAILSYLVQTSGSRDELTVLAGRTEVNSLHSPGAFAKSVEYRHGFGSYVDATLTWMDEGPTALTRRNGAATELWLSRGFFNERLRLAVGAGPYVAIDTYRVAGGTNTADKVSALITMSASYQFARHWVVRGS